MSSSPGPASLIRFGVFEVDLETGELRRHGLKVKLRDQSFQVLALLLERPGQLVTREQLQRKLWAGDTFVDFGRGLNKAINRLREALGDSAETPSFIETPAKRGYRFVAPLEDSRNAVPLPAATVEARVEPGPSPAISVAVRSRTRPWWIVSLLALVAVLAPQTSSRAARTSLLPSAGARRIMLAVLPFENLTGDNEQEYLSGGMTEEMITRLGQLQPHQLGIIARASVMGYKHNYHLDQIAHKLGVQYVVEGSVRRISSQLRIAVQLIRVKDQTQLWSGMYDRNVEEILRLQNQIAGDVAHAIQLKLTPQKQAIQEDAQKINAGGPELDPNENDRERLAKDYTQSAEAHQLYFKGRYLLEPAERRGIPESDRLFPAGD